MNSKFPSDLRLLQPKPHPYRFGRFLKFSTTGAKSEEPWNLIRFSAFFKKGTTGTKSEEPWNLIRKALSERKFRGFWEQTDKTLDERFRFREVYRLLEEHVTVTQKEGKNRAYIARRLLFGRFLKFIAGRDKSEEAWNLIRKALSV
jgi:uncharacterized cupin superfamily protein